MYGLKIKDGGNLQEHLNVFIDILDRFERVDVKTDEEDKALLLTSLPDSYDNMVTTLFYGNDTVKLEEATTLLLFNEIRWKSREAGQDLALVAQGENKKGRSSDRGSSGNRSRSKGMQCYRCKGFGHMKCDCP